MGPSLACSALLFSYYQPSFLGSINGNSILAGVLIAGVLIAGVAVSGSIGLGVALIDPGSLITGVFLGKNGALIV